MSEVFINSKNAVPVLDRNELKGHTGSTFHRVFVPAGRTETAVTAERDKFHVPTVRPRADSTEEEIRKEVRRACQTYGPGGHFIPCITYGAPGCLFKHVDPIINDEIDKYNKETYGI